MMFKQVSLITLAELKPGQRARVVYTKEYGQGLVQHLADMGLNEGSIIEVVTSSNPGPLLVAIKDTTLAIGQGIARRIMVEK